MKKLFLRSTVFLALAATAAAQNVNVQKAASTNAITGNLTIGTGKMLFGDTGSVTNFTTVGIGTGTTAPATMLQVIDTGTGTPRGIINDQYNNGTNSAQINLRKARGTFATPTTIVTGDILSRVIAWGYDGSNFIETGNLRFTSEGTIAATRVPSVFDVYVGTDAAPTVLTQTASFSGRSGITLTAVGTNQSIALIPSGTGTNKLTRANASGEPLTIQNTSVSGASEINFLSSNGTNVGIIGWGNASQSAPYQNSIYMRAGSGAAPIKFIQVNTVAGMFATSGNFLLGALTADGTGPLQFPVATTTSGGITFGVNAHIYTQVSGGTGLNVSGTGTNDSAPAGYYGEFSSSTIASASAVSLTSTTTANVTSLSLTAGDWSVWGNIYFTQGATTTATAYSAGVSQTSATLPGNDGGDQVNLAGTGVALISGNPAPTLTTPVARISLAGTTTVYLTAQSTFLISTQTAFGTLRARRMR